MSASAPSRVIIWFRNDLRLHDNYAVAEALNAAKAGQARQPYTRPAPHSKYLVRFRPRCPDCPRLAGPFPTHTCPLLLSLPQVDVLPLFVFDPRFLADRAPSGPRKCGAFRAQFVREAVVDLKQSLRARGSDLLARELLPTSLPPSLCFRGVRCCVRQPPQPPRGAARRAIGAA